MVRELGRHSVKYLIIFAFLTGIQYAALTVNAVKNFRQYIVAAIEEGDAYAIASRLRKLRRIA
jgi:hypothetical protein